MSKHPEVSIIVPVYNCAHTLEETLTLLKEQDYKGKIEIIVIDNNSKDDSNKIAQKIPNIIIGYQKNIQNAAATRNKGIEIARGEIIAFIDGDCIPAKDWIKQAVNTIENTGVDRIGGKIGVKPLSRQSSIYSLLDALFCFNQECVVNQMQSCMTGNLIVKRKVFDQIGIFNQDYFEMEDIEFGLRAANANISVAYSKDCIVWHQPRNTLQEIWEKSKRNGKGTFTICQKNSQWSGKYGWKHPLRCIKIIGTSRIPYWNILPFEAKEISGLMRFKIFLGSWIIINIGEAYGYFETWIKFTFQNKYS